MLPEDLLLLHPMNIKEIDFYPEFIFKTSRSSGKGGQNVNKVSSKVELSFYVLNSSLLTLDQKNKIYKKLSSKINNDGVLQIICQADRSQLKNKETAIKKFYELLTKCFVEPKKRIKTKPSKAAKEKRITSKKIVSEKKEFRKKIF